MLSDKELRSFDEIDELKKIFYEFFVPEEEGINYNTKTS